MRSPCERKYWHCNTYSNTKSNFKYTYINYKNNISFNQNMTLCSFEPHGRNEMLSAQVDKPDMELTTIKQVSELKEAKI